MFGTPPVRVISINNNRIMPSGINIDRQTCMHARVERIPIRPWSLIDGYPEGGGFLISMGDHCQLVDGSINPPTRQLHPRAHTHTHTDTPTTTLTLTHTHFLSTLQMLKFYFLNSLYIWISTFFFFFYFYIHM